MNKEAIAVFSELADEAQCLRCGVWYPTKGSLHTTLNVKIMWCRTCVLQAPISEYLDRTRQVFSETDIFLSRAAWYPTEQRKKPR